MRLLICAGGTGGGVYPALSVLQAIGNRVEAVLWVGGQGGMEAELVAQSNIPYTSIPAAGLHGVGLRSIPGNLVKLTKGFFQSRRILRDFQPDVLLFTGGFVAVPMAIAGMSRKSVLYVPDIEPGLALRSIARYSDVIALTAPDSRKYFKLNKPMVVTGYPTRNDLVQWDQESARKELHLTNELPVLLIIGGSKGARLINQAVLPLLPKILKLAQVVHICGQSDWQEVSTVKVSLPTELITRYHPYSYLHKEIGAAFASADLVVSRAGASILGELPLFALPAILVPYPFAWRYQKMNADYLASHGAAEVIKNEVLYEELLPSLTRFLSDSTLLAKMRESMSKLATPLAAQKIANLLVDLGTHQPLRGEY